MSIGRLVPGLCFCRARCGDCEPVCPVEATFHEDGVPNQWATFTDENARFSPTHYPGAAGRIPGGATKVVAGWIPRPEWLAATGHPTGQAWALVMGPTMPRASDDRSTRSTTATNTSLLGGSGGGARTRRPNRRATP